ncbi:hypothetical protein BJ742DRAFT_850805 [Cladochytrium replicatum]|nr:hypothetical protein BJ742DRAFT_850805 [Cladochytrium replicatum]
MDTKHPWHYNTPTRGGNLPLRPMSELPPAYDGNDFGFQLPISQGPGPVVIRTQMMFTVRIGFVAAKPEVECTVQPGDVVYVDSISTHRPGFVLGYNVTTDGPRPKEGFKLLPSVCLTGVVSDSNTTSETPPRIPEAAVIPNSPPHSVSTFDVVSSHPDGYLTRNVTTTSQHRLLDTNPSMGSLSSSQNTHSHLYSPRSNDRLAQHAQQFGTYDSPSRRATANSPSRSRSVDSNLSREDYFDRNDALANPQDPRLHSRALATVGTPAPAPYPPPSQPQKESKKKLTRLHWILIIAAIIALGLLGVIAGVVLGRQTTATADSSSQGSNPGGSSPAIGGGSGGGSGPSSSATSASPTSSAAEATQSLPTTGRTTTSNAAATNAVTSTSPPAPATSPTAPAQLPCVLTPQEQFLCSGGVLYRCQNSFWTRTNGCKAEAERKAGSSTGFTFQQTCVEGQGTLASLPGQFGGTVVCPCAETKTAHCSGSHLFRCNGKAWFVFKQCENFNGRVCNGNTGLAGANAAQCQGDTGDE